MNTPAPDKYGERLDKPELSLSGETMHLSTGWRWLPPASRNVFFRQAVELKAYFVHWFTLPTDGLGYNNPAFFTATSSSKMASLILVRSASMG